MIGLNKPAGFPRRRFFYILFALVHRSSHPSRDMWRRLAGISTEAGESGYEALTKNDTITMRICGRTTPIRKN